MNPSNWANELVRTRREKEERDRLDNESRLSDRKRVEANSEAKWQKVRKLLYDFAADLNEAWGAEVVSVENITSHETKVMYGANSVTLKFIPRDHELSVPFYGPTLQLRVNGNDDLVWQSTAERNKFWTDEEVARQSLERAWGR